MAPNSRTLAPSHVTAGGAFGITCTELVPEPADILAQPFVAINSMVGYAPASGVIIDLYLIFPRVVPPLSLNVMADASYITESLTAVNTNPLLSNEMCDVSL